MIEPSVSRLLVSGAACAREIRARRARPQSDWSPSAPGSSARCTPNEGCARCPRPMSARGEKASVEAGHSIILTPIMAGLDSATGGRARLGNTEITELPDADLSILGRCRVGT